MIVITGWRSQIAVAFRALLPKSEPTVWGDPDGVPFPLSADRYLFCQGLLYPKSIADQTVEETELSIDVNYTQVATACRRILALNDRARICVIGSESAYRGSFDGTYAKAKAALHKFVEKTKLQPAQQLVCISPGIIGDAGMTTRRTDAENLAKRLALQPKGRFVTSKEVAELARFLLYGSDYLTGTVIRMHGSTQ